MRDRDIRNGISDPLYKPGAGKEFCRQRGDTLTGWAVRKTFEYVQVPYTSVYYENRFSTVRRMGTTVTD